MGVINPVRTLMKWLKEAGERESVPEAAALATCDYLHQPYVRTVLVRRIDEELEEVTFFTNLESPKSVQLATNPAAALCFHWKSTCKQVRIQGTARLASPKISDEYFAARPRKNQITAWASNQSRTMEHESDLKKNVEACESKFKGASVPRPPNWGGITISVREMEFWKERQGRRHDRALFTKDGSGWKSRTLYP